jgi:hypothetical protein
MTRFIENGTEKSTVPLLSAKSVKATLFATWLNDIYSSYIVDGKIDYIPGRCGEFFGFSAMYDWAVDVDKIDLNIGGETKKELWKHAIKSANRWAEMNKLNPTKETLKKIAVRNYKSELIYKYLVDKYNTTGIKMEIVWDNGQKQLGE